MNKLYRTISLDSINPNSRSKVEYLATLNLLPEEIERRFEIPFEYGIDDPCDSWLALIEDLTTGYVFALQRWVEDRPGITTIAVQGSDIDLKVALERFFLLFHPTEQELDWVKELP